MKGDHFVCKACKCTWQAPNDRKDPPSCPECKSEDIVNLSWDKRRKMRRDDEARERLKKLEHENKLKKMKMDSIRNWERLNRHSRARYK